MGNTKWGLLAIVGVAIVGSIVLLTRERSENAATTAVTTDSVAIAVTKGVELNPRASSDTESALLLQLTERTLFTCRDGKVTPDLAEEVPALANGALKIRLKRGETFADGTAVTTDAVAESLTSLAKEDGPHAETWKSWIATVEKSGDDAVMIKTKKANPFAIALLCHPFTAIGKKTDAGRIGAGKYAWTRTSADELELKSSDEALPKIRLVEYSDAAAALKALADGKVALDLAELSGAEDSALPSNLGRAIVDDRSVSMVFYAPKQGKNNRAVVEYLRGSLATDEFVKELDVAARPTREVLPGATESVAATPPTLGTDVDLTLTTPATAGAAEFSRKLAARLEPGKIKLAHVEAEPAAFAKAIDERQVELWGAVVRSPYNWPFESVDACKKYSPAYLKYPRTNEVLAKIGRSSLTEAFGLLSELNAALLEESYCVPVARQSLSIAAKSVEAAKEAAENLLSWARKARGT